MQALPVMLQVFPSLAPMLQSQTAARAMFREFLRVFRIENTQAFLGSPAQDLMQSQLLQMLSQQPPQLGMGSPMGQPGMPPPGMPGQAPMGAAPMMPPAPMPGRPM
jgi:hypothetical protein